MKGAALHSLVIAGLDPAIHRTKRTFRNLMDARASSVKTCFALLPAHDELEIGGKA